MMISNLEKRSVKSFARSNSFHNDISNKNCCENRCPLIKLLKINVAIVKRGCSVYG